MPERAPKEDAITAVPGIRVGHWTRRRSLTGLTVVRCDAGAAPGFFAPGGAPGTLDTDLLRPENSVQRVHAVMLTGGSLFGLEAAGGIKRRLLEEGVGLEMRPDAPRIPIVTGAVVFDLAVGKPDHPGEDGGYRAAASAASASVAQGNVGAGTGCSVAKTGADGTQLKSGIGTAAVHHDSGLVAGAIVAVNAVGDVIDPRDGSLAAGARGARRGEMIRASEALRAKPYAEYIAEAGGNGAGANTTLAVVATNAKLSKAVAGRLAIMAGAGLARTISPAFTPGDGDCVFTLATGEISISGAPALMTLLGTMASEAVERAVLNAVRTAEGAGGIPSAAEWTGGSSKAGRRTRKH